MFEINLPKKFILVIFIALVVVFITSGLGCKKTTEEETTAPLSPPVAKPVEKPPEAKPEEVKPPVAEPKEEVESEEKLSAEDEQALVLKQAEKIAQIFGTYATTDNPPFRNLRDLKAYGTNHFNSWLDKIIKDVAPTGPFQGWATTAISSAILESSFDSMKILITCKKEEFLETERAPKISYQMLILDFKKVEEDWKVDRAEWL